MHTTQRIQKHDQSKGASSKRQQNGCYSMYRNPNCAQKKGTEPSPVPSPVELLKAETASIVVVDLMNRILQNLPSLFSVFGVHLHLVFKGLYLEILLLSLIHLGRPGGLRFSQFRIRDGAINQSISPRLRRQGRGCFPGPHATVCDLASGGMNGSARAIRRARWRCDHGWFPRSSLAKEKQQQQQQSTRVEDEGGRS